MVCQNKSGGEQYAVVLDFSLHLRSIEVCEILCTSLTTKQAFAPVRNGTLFLGMFATNGSGAGNRWLLPTNSVLNLKAASQ